MRKASKYRISPTNGQQRILNTMLEQCRFVYNQTLAARRQAWEQRQESLALYDTQSLLPTWKAERPSLKLVHSQVLQNVQVRVDLAFKAFFRRVKQAADDPGYPRFKGFGRYDSITYPQYGNGVRLQGSTLILSKIGSVKVILHRPVEGQIKTVTIRRSATGKWYASLSVEATPQPLAPSQTALGVDVGLSSFATLSNGEKIANPRFFRSEEHELAKVQRKLSKAEKGTQERAKRRKIVSRVHERIAFRRSNFAHQESRKLVARFGVLAFEDLNAGNMLKNHCLAKSISDAAWNHFVLITTSKAEEAGRRVVLIDPRNTSKRCSRCGRLVEKDLSVRVHSCPICGLVIDRDENAAINILALGLQCLGESP
jgi:putative transposase